MQKKFILATILFALCGIARADSIIDYSISGGSSANWSGQFQVHDLSLPANDNALGNTVGLSANGLLPLIFGYFGSNGEGGLWFQDNFGNGLQLQSQELYDSVLSSSVNGDWTSLLGHSYSINSTAVSPDYYFTQFTDGNGGLLYGGYGGQISFSNGGAGDIFGGGGGVNAVPEPSLLVLLLIGAIGTGSYAGLKRFNRS